MLALALTAPVTAAAQTRGRCVVVPWPYSARDQLVVGVVPNLLLPVEHASPTTNRARPLLDAMAVRLRRLQSAPISRAYGAAVDAQARALVALHLRPIDTLAARAEALRDAATTVDALVLQARAHERVAERLAGLPELVVPSPAERARMARAEEAIARLERLAATSEEMREFLERERTSCHYPVVDPSAPEEECGQRIARRWDDESTAHRQVAIVLYATAVHLARAHHVTSGRVWDAAERLRDETNRPLLDVALQHQTLFALRPGEFDGQSPGALLLETARVAGARLAQ